MRSEEGSGATVDKYMYIIYRSHDRCSIRAARPVARRPLLLTLISPDWPRGASRGCVSSPDSRTLLSGLSGWAPPSSDILFVQQLYKDLCRVSIVGCKGQQFDPQEHGSGWPCRSERPSGRSRQTRWTWRRSRRRLGEWRSKAILNSPHHYSSFIPLSQAGHFQKASDEELRGRV